MDEYMHFIFGTQIHRGSFICTDGLYSGRSLKTSWVYSPRRLRTGSCSGQRENVLSVGNCCYVAVCKRGGRLGGARRYGAITGRRGAGAYRVATRTAWLLFIEERTRLLPDEAADSTRCEIALRALHVDVNYVYMRTVHKWSQRDNGHLIPRQIWMQWRYHVWAVKHEAIWNILPKPEQFLN